MSRTLRLADDLTLPLDAVTETFGVLAARGAGKSNLAAVMAEQMFAAGLPFVVVDPVGSWFGLRAGADGQKDGGLPLPIFGGKHGDVPLERHGGELLADLVVNKRLSCVLDLSGFDSEAAKKAFLLDFARRLYVKNEDPLHLFLEEADDYIPQRPMRDEAQLLRAWENIVRRGRARGLGLTLITQRSASLNKSVLTQVQTLFVLRTTGPQDRAAIEAWVKYHDTDDQVLSSLSGLGHGEGWVWSPQFLGRMSRHRFHRRQTFDSGATPKNLRGKDARPAATLADVDLSALQVQMAATIERAKADDPKELRRQITELRQQLAKAQRVGPSSTSSPPSEKQEVPVLTDADRKLLKAVRDEFLLFSENIGVKADQALDHLAERAKAAIDTAVGAWTKEVQQRRGLFLERLEKTRVQKVLDKLERVSVADLSRKDPGMSPGIIRPRTAQPPSALSLPARPVRSNQPTATTTGELDGAQRKILDTIGMVLARGLTPNRDLIARWIGIHPNGGRYNSNLAFLRAHGYLDGLQLTPEGASHATLVKTGFDAALNAVDGSQQAILETLYSRGQLTRDELAAALGIHPNGGRFNSNLARLRTMGLITDRGPIALTEAALA